MDEEVIGKFGSLEHVRDLLGPSRILKAGMNCTLLNSDSDIYEVISFGCLMLHRMNPFLCQKVLTASFSVLW